MKEQVSQFTNVGYLKLVFPDREKIICGQVIKPSSDEEFFMGLCLNKK